MKKYKIILFQKYIRSFVTNFSSYLSNFDFILEHKEETNVQLYKKLNNFSNEINRIKTNKLLKIRRFFGIPNVRIKISNYGDLFFTYGCFVLGNKPYCIYSETGLSVYSYDRKIADNPIARLIVSFLIKQKNLKKIIFLSKAAEKSFLSSAKYSKKTQEIVKAKSAVCYPLMEAPEYKIKEYSGNLKLLFIGTFYIKGGLELVNAFNTLKEKYKNIELSIISSISIIQEKDIELIKNSDGINLFDAKFNKAQLDEFYRSHDVFVMPTYRDGFGLVWIEALSHAMPIIGTKQYATEEFCNDGHNGFMYNNHPLQDYNPETFEIYGQYYNPKDFYARLFRYQQEGKMKQIEDFIYISIEKLLLNPELLNTFSKNSLQLYQKEFSSQVISQRIESIFLDSINK